MGHDLQSRLSILTEGAKYDVSCASSGSNRGGRGRLGHACPAGVCHTWSDDGRCVSLLKLLLTNDCIYDCAYCINRRSNDVPRASFTPREVAEITAAFYRRNYIEGLFLSSAVRRSPDDTMLDLVRTVALLRREFGFGGYVHAKVIPGASHELVDVLGRLADRVSVNVELPTERSLGLWAPQKSAGSIFTPMKYISGRIEERTSERRPAKRAPSFAPAGQSTQMIVGATPEPDLTLLRLSEGLYGRMGLKRVYYSAYVPVNDNPTLPAPNAAPPLLREHRLYQADWLLRFYGFRADEIVDEGHPNLEERLDPKSAWALRHMDLFPVDPNRAEYETLLRVPGIGVTSARRILTARRTRRLDRDNLRRLGVTMKRAQHFLRFDGRLAAPGYVSSLEGLRTILEGGRFSPQLWLPFPEAIPSPRESQQERR